MTKTTKDPARHQREAYEKPEVVKMGKIIDLTNGNTGSSTDSNSQTIPVQK